MRDDFGGGSHCRFRWRARFCTIVDRAQRRRGAVIGSCGPTTSSRMDAYAPVLYARGASGAIGKGRIGDAVKSAMREYGAVYLLATGGAGALLAKCVTSAEIVAFPELGAEAIRRLEVVEMPLIVGVDAEGRDLYDQARPLE